MTEYSIDVTTATFKEDVIDASLHTPVVVDFWAEWCGPCKVLKPVLEKLAAEYAGRFLLAKVDSDANPELASHFGIRSIPTVVAIANGQIVDGFTGAKTEAQLREWLEKFVPPAAEPAVPPEADTCAAIAALLDADDMAAAEAALHVAIAQFGRSEMLEPLIERFSQRQRQAAAAAAAAPLLAAKQAEVAAAPDNHALRMALVESLLEVGQYRDALEHLLASVRIDRNWNEDAARKQMIALFNQLGEDPAQQGLVREFRSQLARTLN